MFSFEEFEQVVFQSLNLSRLYIEGLKENVIVGHLIPAGTGLREYQNLLVGSNKEYQQMKKESLVAQD